MSRLILKLCDVSHHALIQRVGRGGGRGSGLLPEKNLQKIGLLGNTGPDPIKKSHSYKTSIHCWTIISTPARRNLNGVSLVGPMMARRFSEILILSPLISKKIVVRVRPPLTKLSHLWFIGILQDDRPEEMKMPNTVAAAP